MYDFDTAFEEVMEAHGLEEWYQLFDSHLFGEVVQRLRAQHGDDVTETAAFEAWYEEMAEDL